LTIVFVFYGLDHDLSNAGRFGLSHLACRHRRCPKADTRRVHRGARLIQVLAGTLLLLVATLPHGRADVVLRVESDIAIREEGEFDTAEGCYATSVTRRLAQQGMR